MSVGYRDDDCVGVDPKKLVFLTANSDYLDFGAGKVWLPDAQNFEVEAKVSGVNAAGVHAIIGQSRAISTTDRWALYINDGDIVFNIANVTATAAGSYTEGTIKVVVISGAIEIFLDDVSISTGTSTVEVSSAITSIHLFVGAYGNGTGNAPQIYGDLTIHWCRINSNYLNLNEGSGATVSFTGAESGTINTSNGGGLTYINDTMWQDDVEEIGVTPPLDDYTGAQTAYSIARKLRTAYTGDAIRVRADAGEFITNGDFPTNTTGWTATGSTLAVVSAELEITTSASYGRASQDITVVAGHTYIVSVDFTKVATNGILRAGTTTTGSEYFSQTLSSTGTYSYSFTATGTTASISLWTNSATASLTTLWDNVSVTQEEADIGFDGNGDLDETALLAHCGANSGYITKAYDNSGNANDWVQATANKQPRIVNAGVVEKVNGKPAMFSDATATSQDVLTSTLTGSATTTAFHVYKNERDITYVNYGVPTVHYGNSWNGQAGAHYSAAGTPVNYINGASIGTSRDNLYDATNTLQVVNSYTNLNLSNANWSEFNTDYDGSDAFNPITYIQETIIYDSDKSSDRAAIETNINEYYGVYP